MNKNSEIRNPESAIKQFPSKVKRTCRTAEVGLYNKETKIHLCGRLMKFGNAGCGFLKDESGEIEVQFCDKNVEIQVGDILQLSGKVKQNKFRVDSYKKLVDGALSIQTNQENNRYSPWYDFLGNPGKMKMMQFRSNFLQTIRDFFYQQGFIELDVPSLVNAAGMEPHIEPFTTHFSEKDGRSESFFLHTSPEFALKKMLTAGFEKIFYLGHVFRNGENTPLHTPEFTMLEWYRAYQDYTSIMKDCEDLLSFLTLQLQSKWSTIWRDDDLLQRDWQFRSLADIMLEKCGLVLDSIREEDQDAMLKIIRKQGIADGEKHWPIDDLFFLLFINMVEPWLGKEEPTILKDYPLWLASLAKRKEKKPDFVERFELYIDGIELANAFTELNDPNEQLQRLDKEKTLREVLSRTEIPIDDDFIGALRVGMPPAAGIALGVDRLIMVCSKQEDIRHVLPYYF